MTSRLLYPLGLFVVLACLAGCVQYDPGPWPTPVPPVPVPPDPGPVVPPPTPPVPDVQVPRSTFDTVEVGDPAETLSELPAPERIVTDQDGTRIHVWALDEPRPEGGWVRWEVHVRGDKIVASFAY